MGARRDAVREPERRGAPRAGAAGVAVRRQARQWDAEGQEAAANFHARRRWVGGRSRGRQARRRGSVARDARNRRQPLERRVADSLNNRWSRMLQQRGPDGSPPPEALLPPGHTDAGGKLPIHAMSTKMAAAEPPVPDRCPHRPRALVQPDRREAGRAHRAAEAQMAARAGSRAPRRAGGCDGGPGGAGSNLHAGSGGGRAHDAGSGGVRQHHGGGGERRSGGHGHWREGGEETGTSELEDTQSLCLQGISGQGVLILLGGLINYNRRSSEFLVQ